MLWFPITLHLSLGFDLIALPIGRAVESYLLKWGINRLFTITTDNANSSDVAIDYMKKKTKERDNSILVGEFMHMYCCANILNLIV